MINYQLTARCGLPPAPPPPAFGEMARPSRYTPWCSAPSPTPTCQDFRPGPWLSFPNHRRRLGWECRPRAWVRLPCAPGTSLAMDNPYIVLSWDYPMDVAPAPFGGRLPQKW
jgi:hypothetical protein